MSSSTTTTTTTTTSAISRIFVPNLLGRQSVTLNFLGDVEVLPHEVDYSLPAAPASTAAIAHKRTASTSSMASSTQSTGSRSSSFSSAVGARLFGTAETQAGKGAVAFWAE